MYNTNRIKSYITLQKSQQEIYFMLELKAIRLI